MIEMVALAPVALEVLRFANTGGRIYAAYLERQNKFQFQENEHKYQKELEKIRAELQDALAKNDFQRSAGLQKELQSIRQEFERSMQQAQFAHEDALAKKNFQRSAELQRELLEAKFEFERSMQQIQFDQQEANWEKDQFVKHEWPLEATPKSFVKYLEQLDMPMLVIVADNLDKDNKKITELFAQFFNLYYGLNTGVYVYNQGWKPEMANRTGNAQRKPLHQVLSGLPTLLLIPTVSGNNFQLNVTMWGWDAKECFKTVDMLSINIPQLERQILREIALEWKGWKFSPTDSKPYFKTIQQNLKTISEEDKRRYQLKKEGKSVNDIERYCSKEFVYLSEGLDDVQERKFKKLATHLLITASLFVDAYRIGCSQIPKLPCLLAEMPLEFREQYGMSTKNAFKKLAESADELNRPRMLTCLAQAYAEAGDKTTAKEFWTETLNFFDQIYTKPRKPIDMEHWGILQTIRQSASLPTTKYPYLLKQAVDVETAERIRKEEEEKRTEQMIRLGPTDNKAGTRLVMRIFNNKVEFIFRWCPAGSFMMGASPSELEQYNDEILHKVTLTKGFWLMETPVTQVQWQAVMGTNPSFFNDDNLPVENINWGDCQEFCRKCHGKNWSLCLPTEAQWEYACRAGTTTAFSWGNRLKGDKANCNGNYPYGTTDNGPYKQQTTAVGLYGANAWGFYDMHGNVMEWCSDLYDNYHGDTTIDPTGPSRGYGRVLRGGSWKRIAKVCRSAMRSFKEATSKSNEVGVRFCLKSE